MELRHLTTINAGGYGSLRSQGRRGGEAQRTHVHRRKYSACRLVELGPALNIRAPPPKNRGPATITRRQRCGAEREDTHEQHHGRWFGRGGGNTGRRSDRTAGTEAPSIR